MDLIIFDLDGTLIDSKLDLALGVNATRQHLGLEPLDNELVASYVGNGAPLLMRRAFGADASEETVAGALEYFLGYYREHCLDNTRAYDGIPEALEEFHRRGVQMAVLTNKPTPVSRTIIDGLGLGRYFARVYGGNSFERKKPDPAGALALMAELGARREATAMVGDSSVDMETARNAGITACGVTWGLQPDSLQQHEPDIIVNRPDELVEAVFGKD